MPELSGKLKEPHDAKERKFDEVVAEAVESAVLIIVY